MTNGPRTHRGRGPWLKCVIPGGTTPTLPLLERLAAALSLTLTVSLTAAERRND